jgi:ParB family chromosome partitioning protein
MDDYATVSPSDLVTRPPFSDLFSVRPKLQETIAQSMREKGFDPSKPINVWRQENTVVDGHTRHGAAIDAGIKVLVCYHDFKDEDEAMDYAISNQRDRRNLSDAELFSLIQAVDKRRKRGGDTKSETARKSKASREAFDPPAKTAEATAKTIGTSRSKVEKARAIIGHAEKTGDVTELHAVKAGRLSIHRAAKSVGAKKATRAAKRKAQEAERKAQKAERVKQCVAWLVEHDFPGLPEAVSQGFDADIARAAQCQLLPQYAKLQTGGKKEAAGSARQPDPPRTRARKLTKDQKHRICTVWPEGLDGLEDEADGGPVEFTFEIGTVDSGYIDLTFRRADGEKGEFTVMLTDTVVNDYLINDLGEAVNESWERVRKWEEEEARERPEETRTSSAAPGETPPAGCGAQGQKKGRGRGSDDPLQHVPLPGQGALPFPDAATG